MPEARTRIRASPGPGTGLETSVQRMVPLPSYKATFIVAKVLPPPGELAERTAGSITGESGRCSDAGVLSYAVLSACHISSSGNLWVTISSGLYGSGLADSGFADQHNDSPLTAWGVAEGGSQYDHVVLAVNEIITQLSFR